MLKELYTHLYCLLAHILLNIVDLHKQICFDYQSFMHFTVLRRLCVFRSLVCKHRKLQLNQM